MRLIKTLFCEFCSNPFRKRATLNLHLSRIHDKRKSFTCNNCKETLIENVKNVFMYN